MRATASARLFVLVVVRICLACHFDRALGEEQSLGDRGLGEALGDQLQDLELECGGRCVRCRGRLGCGAQGELLELAGSSSEFGGGGLERFLRELGVGDVLHDPDHTGWVAGVIDHDLPLVAERADPAVGADRTHFEGVCGSLFDGARDCLRDELAVGWVDVITGGGGAGIKLVWREPVDIEQADGRGDVVCGEVPLAAAGPCDALGLS